MVREVTWQDVLEQVKHPLKVVSDPDPDANGRVLVHVQAYDDDVPFVPKPETITYASGNKAQLGIKRVERDDKGRALAVVYDNPKDSAADKYTEQRYDLDKGTFIFPTQHNPALRKELLETVGRITGGQLHVDLTTIDTLLKEVYALYRKHEAVPDLYNGDIQQLSPEKHVFIEGEKRVWGGGAGKVAGVKDAYIVRDCGDGKTPSVFTGIHGGHIVDGQQFSEGTFVVVAERDKHGAITSVRKLDADYVAKDLRLVHDGSKLDLSGASLDWLQEDPVGAVVDLQVIGKAARQAKPDAKTQGDRVLEPLQEMERVRS